MINRGGRPTLTFTTKDRAAVMEGVAIGMTVAHVALALDVAPGSLRKHCGAEIEQGRARKKLELTQLLFKQARGGSTAAAKHLASAIEHADMTDIAQAKRQAPPVLGKKARAEVAAATAHEGTDWASILNDDPAH